MNKYKVFKFTSRNTGYYFEETNSLATARIYAKFFSKCRIDTYEGPNGTFELYENGIKTEWSTNKL